MGLKWKDIFKAVKVGTSVGSVVAPGGVGMILKEVNKSIDDESDPNNEAALKTLGQVNDEQTAAILALHERNLDLERRLKKLEEAQ